MRRLGERDFARMPWKNGGGSTTELLVEPSGATLATGFTLRVSCADVGTSGPFSAFPGCDRLLLLLAGELTLHGAPAGAIVLDGPGAQARLSGEWALSATLHDGPARDFNVIFARAAWRAALETIELDGTLQREAPAGGQLLLFVRDGALQEAAAGELLQTRGRLHVTALGRAALALVTLAPA